MLSGFWYRDEGFSNPRVLEFADDSVDDAFAPPLEAPKTTEISIERLIDPFEAVEVYEGNLSAAREMGVCANASSKPTSPRRFSYEELNPIYK